MFCYLDIDRSIILSGASQNETFLDGSSFTGSVIWVFASANPMVSDLTIQNGWATDSIPDGGGITNQGVLQLDRVVLRHNSADNAGGAITNSGRIYLNYSEVFSNTAWFGGAIFNEGGLHILGTVVHSNGIKDLSGFAPGIQNNRHLNIVNSTFSGHRDGGAISNSYALTTTNITVAHNDIGIENYGSWQTTNTLLGENYLLNCISGGTVSSMGNNLEDYDECSLDHINDIVNTAVRLMPLDNYSYLVFETLTHALMSTSPAIDGGLWDYCGPIDQRGFERPTNKCDIGAFEFQNTIYIPFTQRP